MGTRVVMLMAIPMVAVLSLGCRAESGTTAAYVLRDSAGVTISESREPHWIGDARWEIGPDPLVTIGEMEGQSEYLLFRVRGALRLGDGTIVVADGGSNEIRFYSEFGTFLRGVGRRGEGPGEFRLIGLLGLAGRDSLVVWDPALGRGTLLGADGSLGRTFPGPEPMAGFTEAYLTGVFGDGSFLGSASAGIRPMEYDRGLLRSSALFFRFWPSGRTDTIGPFHITEGFVTRDRGFIPMPLGFNALSAAWGDHFYYCDGGSFEIREYSSRGRHVRIVREPRQPVPLTEEHVAAFIESRTASIRNPDEKRRQEALLREVSFHRTLPSYREMRIDSEGNLWMAPYPPPGEEQPGWRVFEKEGRLLGTVETPRGFFIQQIGPDFLLGTATDSLGVERVILLRLDKGGA